MFEMLMNVFAIFVAIAMFDDWDFDSDPAAESVWSLGDMSTVGVLFKITILLALS